MKTPREKYENDPHYRNLVLTLEKLIEEARFTPSELREASILACINYEMRHLRDHSINPYIEDSLKILDDFVSKKRNRK